MPTLPTELPLFDIRKVKIPLCAVVPVYYCDPSLYQVIDASLDSLRDYPFMVVNDASPLEFPLHWKRVINNAENRGFTASVNLGLDWTFSNIKECEVVVVMNDDIVMTEECMDRFKGLKGLVIASPMDTASSDDDRFGACWGMTRETYELLGPLDETYRNYYSDLDYYQRAKEAGVEIVKWKDITLDHSESATFGLLDKEALLREDAERWEGRV